MTYQGSWHVGPYPVYLVLGGIPLMAQPLIDWLQMGEMTSGAEGIFLRGGNGQHGGSHRTYWQPYAPFRGRLCFLILICSHTAGSYCRGTPLPSGDPPSVAHNWAGLGPPGPNPGIVCAKKGRSGCQPSCHFRWPPVSEDKGPDR
jgi:hypothetical protein